LDTYTNRCYTDDKQVDKTEEVAVTGSTFVVPRKLSWIDKQTYALDTQMATTLITKTLVNKTVGSCR
jgi:hypothetical protein